MASQQERETKPLRDYAVPQVQNLHSSIRRPLIQANNFEIKPSIIQMIQTAVQFGGLPNDDSNAHIINFLEICDTFKANDVTDDAIRLRLFPFSLRNKAKSWLNSLPAGSINTWDDLAQKFLAKFFPLAKSAKMLNDITFFMQFDSESLYEAWERYKDLMRRCTHHGLPKWLQVQTFHNSLLGPFRTTIDAVARGVLMSKSINEAYDLLEEIASNNYQWPYERLDSIRNLEIQVGQLANALNTIPQGTLPSDTEPNPRREGKEHCMAIAFRNGKELCKKIKQMPSYLKFLKNILTKKRKLEEFETVALTEECSAIIHNKLPPKLKDLESFSIPCTIGSFKISKALCDLGASVSIMSLSIANKLGFQEIQPTTVTLQLANRTIRHSIGIIEDVLLKVGHLHISVDFIVLEIEYDVEIPLILGRPCLATAGALIDVKNGKITFRVGEEEVVFNLFNATRYPYTDSCYKVDLVNEDKSKPIPPPSTEQAPILETKPPPLSNCLDFVVGQRVVLSDSQLHLLPWNL
ncbi:Retrotransposon gag domain - like 10 [Theobroma cacao]|nr:Retrotransposon gag domain - like 10 [Theobroma cacao]